MRLLTDQWQLDAAPTQRRTGGAKRAARALRGGSQSIPAWMLAKGLVIVETQRVAPKAIRRGDSLPTLAFEVDADADAAYVVAVRHATGALTFHTPMPARRSGRARASTLAFEIPVRTVAANGPGVRRGSISRAVEIVVLKIVRKIADAIAPQAIGLLEEAWWKGQPLGLVKVSRSGLLAGRLPALNGPVSTGPSGRALLFIHGAFSSTVGAFRDLAATDFFDAAAERYGDHIYGFDHLTLSNSPVENAKLLLSMLPTSATVFDVVTHSRGGLVLRSIVEGLDEDLPQRSRFELGHAVLVAAPNVGTPLATPGRWRETVGWFANLVEMLPENPFTTAADFVANGLVWIADAATAYMPGLAAMDADGDFVTELLLAPDGPPDGYSAVVADYVPPDSIALRLLDLGVDSFFAGANDLVVPTEGGWRISAAGTGIKPGRIAAFGPGGNIGSPGDAVHHLNIVGNPATAAFIQRALRNEPQNLPVAVSPAGRSLRRTMSERASPERHASTSMAPEAAPKSAVAPVSVPDVYPDTLHVLILGRTPEATSAKASNGEHENDNKKIDADLVVSYAGATIVAPFRYSGGDAGKRSQAIIARNQAIKAYVDGKKKEPTEGELLEFGIKLFEWIFPAEVRSLYDVARTIERKGRLSIIFTCMIPWVAEKPIEFAYDPLRKTFLATEEVHFIRNVVTAVPADRLVPSLDKLRILVVIAQPIGLGGLSAKEEEDAIRQGFAAHIETGLVEIDVLRSATPARLHGWIMSKPYDVVHFIGHGDLINGEGHLLFEDGRGNSLPVPVRMAREILCQRNVKLIFLNACDTGRGSYSDFNSGIAQGLVAGGVPAVVANQFKVLDPSATAFAQHFYWSLAQGFSIGAAAREARIAVNYSIYGENIDWAVPVVYARDPNGRLCARRPLPRDFNFTPGRTRKTRRGAEQHVRQVAIWDVNHVFPDLRPTIERMNSVQRQFGFELVFTAAPIGTWRHGTRSGSTNDIQLDVVAAARKLKGKTAELDVDYLMCITDRDFFDHESTGYFGWWWAEGDPEDLPRNVAFFSSRVDGLPRVGPDAGRAVVNFAVTGLAAMLADLEAHGVTGGKGQAERRHCPMYENSEVRLDLVIGPQAFCQPCRQKLRAVASRQNGKLTRADVDALEAILRELS